MQCWGLLKCSLHGFLSRVLNWRHLTLSGVEMVVMPPGASPGLTSGFTGHSAVGLSTQDLIPEMGVWGAERPLLSLLQS